MNTLHNIHNGWCALNIFIPDSQYNSTDHLYAFIYFIKKKEKEKRTYKSGEIGTINILKIKRIEKVVMQLRR